MKKWRTIVALVLLILAVIFNWGWFWSILVGLWIVYIIKDEKIHFVEEVTKKENPKLYWCMVLIWSFFALYSILTYLY